MVSHLFYYQLALLAIIWLFVMLHVTWAEPGLTTPAVPAKPKRKRSTEPKPFAGLTQKPHCALCDQETLHTAPASPLRPDPMPPTNRRPRTVDTSMHFCPHLGCDYCGWPGLNNLRANGHPSGGPWRQLHCTACDGYFPEHHGFMATFGDVWRDLGSSPVCVQGRRALPTVGASHAGMSSALHLPLRCCMAPAASSDVTHYAPRYGLA